MEEKNVNYEAWALGMCNLLDAIERTAGADEIDDKDEVIGDMCRSRFALARLCGVRVAYHTPSSGEIH